MLLEFLSEVEVGEDAAKILQDYRYFRLYFESQFRKMKTMFGTVEDGVKVAEASVEKNLKAFRAYLQMAIQNCRVCTFGLES